AHHRLGSDRFDELSRNRYADERGKTGNEIQCAVVSSKFVGPAELADTRWCQGHPAACSEAEQGYEDVECRKRSGSEWQPNDQHQHQRPDYRNQQYIEPSVPVRQEARDDSAKTGHAVHDADK
ncbi:hypothetical protein LTS18_002487, partial [Coniosporium uncinatum]